MDLLGSQLQWITPISGRFPRDYPRVAHSAMHLQFELTRWLPAVNVKN